MSGRCRLRSLLSTIALGSAFLLGGCAVYPANPGYGYNYGYAYPGPYYGGAFIGVGGGWHGGWNHGWHEGWAHGWHPGAPLSGHGGPGFVHGGPVHGPSVAGGGFHRG